MPDALPTELHAAVSLGLLLLASLLGGIAADLLRVPKVTAYLLAGMIVGPSAANLISQEQLHHLAPLAKLAMALVLLELGCHFPLAQLRPILRHALWLSAGELVATFLAVSLAVYFCGGGVAVAVLLGALALATAPATTILVLKESRSEGPVTELASVLVALNNIVAVVAFEFLFLSVQVFHASDAEMPVLPQAFRLMLELGGACSLGILSGLVLSYGSGLLSQRRWLVMVIAVSILMMGLCESWHFPYMLAFLLAGVVLVNTSDKVPDLLAEQEKIAGLLVVVFFAVHGAELRLAAFFQAGLMGVAYILARSAGKIVGLGIATRIRGEAQAARNYLGSCMLAQAGAAIALAVLAAERWPEVGLPVQTIILGSVVFFEIVGPVSIRWSVLAAGEVPLAQAISHRTESASSQAGKMWSRGCESLGLKSKQQKPMSSMDVSSLLRRNVKGISQSAHFDEVVSYIQRSRDNTYIVVDSDSKVVGVIRYTQLSDTFFDSSIDDLVRAEDLSSPVCGTLFPDDPLTRAVELFRNSSDDVLPVVSRDQAQQLVGVL
ncbi:MAG: cation:proton antiporter, partial [Planctomycetales bacterium]|nr:cation:proton antiporter [Planctomycetales bacterium]